MRSFIYLLVIAAAGYVGYTYYKDKIEGKPDEEASAVVATAPGRQTEGVQPAPVLPFKSNVPDVAPGEKHIAKPGVFYVLERTSIQHASGVAAVVPGEEVKLLKRNDNGTMKVTTGKYDFEMKESQLTNDLDLARAAERNYVSTHPPSR